jgi:hypothetical protein
VPLSLRRTRLRRPMRALNEARRRSMVVMTATDAEGKEAAPRISSLTYFLGVL